MHLRHRKEPQPRELGRWAIQGLGLAQERGKETFERAINGYSLAMVMLGRVVLAAYGVESMEEENRILRTLRVTIPIFLSKLLPVRMIERDLLLTFGLRQ
jgi:hypothetical protein